MRHPSRPRTVKAAVAALAGLGAVLASLAASPAPSSAAQATAARAAANPLAGRPWGVYQGRADQVWQPYVEATGLEKVLLGKIALTPRAKWFGAWVGPSALGDKVRDYIANAQAGDPEALVQMADFHLKPWEHDACRSLPTTAQQSTYKQWTDAFAAALGDAHVAVVLQPDGPFALCAPHGSRIYSQLLRYAARAYSAHPNTSVYIDAGAADWLRDDPAKAARILVPAGVAYARGFALNSTHYSATGREVRFSAAVSRELARRGFPDKHGVINTSSNGKPFAGYTYTGPDFDNARVCASTTDTACVTLGIPPTTDVANPAWGLSDANDARAARYVDAYLWFGRPWLYKQADPFLKDRALQLVRTSPY